jgi:VIT1/CCC1 family predicted Fe2+/Mn2+ transporter
VADTTEAKAGEHGSEGLVYEPHVGTTRQYWRDIVLGVNDGLVSVFLLVVGVVGGGLEASQVLLAAIAAAVAGAISMGAGEYLATQSQEEVLDSELALERTHIKHFRDGEVDQLRGFFEDMAVTEDDMDEAVAIFSRNDEVLLNAMAALEFGIVESERRSPYTAMWMSSSWFLLGSLPAVLPFAFIDDTPIALTVAAAATAVGLFAVGAVKTLVTRTEPVRSGFNNLIITAFGGVAAYFIGVLIDAGIS